MSYEAAKNRMEPYRKDCGRTARNAARQCGVGEGSGLGPGEQPQRMECAPDDSGVRECAAGRAAVRVCSFIRDFLANPYQICETPIQEMSFAVLWVQFYSIQLTGIWVNFTLKRTRLEHVGLISRISDAHEASFIVVGVLSSLLPVVVFFARLVGYPVLASVRSQNEPWVIPTRPPLLQDRCSFPGCCYCELERGSTLESPP